MKPSFILGCDLSMNSSIRLINDEVVLYQAGNFIVHHNLNTKQTHLTEIITNYQGNNSDVSDIGSPEIEFDVNVLNSNCKTYALALSLVGSGGSRKVRHQIRLFVLDKKEKVKTFDLPSKAKSVCFSHDNRYLSAWTINQEILVWDLKSHKTIVCSKFSCLNQSETSFEVEKHIFLEEVTTSYVIAASAKNTACFINFFPEYATPLKLVPSKNPHFEDITDISCIDENLLMIGCVDGSITVIDTKFSRLPVLVPSILQSFSVQAFFDGIVVMKSPTEQAICSLDKGSKQLKEVVRFLNTTSANLKTVSISQSSKTIAAVSEVGELMYAEFKNGILASRNKSKLWDNFQSFHTSEISLLSFDREHGIIASVDSKMNLKLWDITSNHVILSHYFENRVIALEFHPTGHFLLACTENDVCQYLVTSKGLSRLNSCPFPNVVSCKYNPHGMLVLAYNNYDGIIFHTTNTAQYCKYTGLKSIKGVNWLNNYTFSIDFEDGTVEHRTLTIKDGSFNLIKPPNASSAGTIRQKESKVDYKFNALADPTTNEWKTIHAKAIAGAVNTFNGGYLTYGTDGAISLYHSNGLLAHYAKKNLLLDEILVSPKSLTELSQSSEEIIKSCRRERSVFREKMNEIVSRHNVTITDTENANENDRAKQMEIIMQLTVYQSAKKGEHNQALNELSSQLRTIIKSKQEGHNDHLKSIMESIQLTVTKIKETETIMTEKQTTMIAFNDKSLKLLEDETREKLRNISEAMENRRRELDRCNVEYNAYISELSKVVDDELTELEIEFRPKINHESSLIQNLVRMKGDTETQLQTVIENLNQVKAAADTQKKVVEELKRQIGELDETRKQLQSFIMARNDIIEEKDRLYDETEKTYMSSKQNCFLLESQLKIVHENVKPQIEALHLKQNEIYEMGRELKQMQKEEFEKLTVGKKLEKILTLKSRELRGIISNINALRQLRERINVDMLESRQELGNIADQVIFVKKLSVKYGQKDRILSVEDKYEEVKQTMLEQRVAFTRIANLQHQFKDISIKERSGKGDLNAQRITLMQELSDLKAILSDFNK